ncbi:arsenic resistance N-acetyltransferase ArsN2 [Caballeronia sp. Lep1P3]|uniref:arsenic resistance N-acetyltransferase ArsN2 n=1 Tax=Caballeronia sp. Lep1P3 TaxID=2878150 RepID=UPI00025B9DBC|nr:arsenic resistance N-acetyltransferase ArsN2 [Caballeronia sp. Lep1P3]EKS72784.1 N-acetyltransferase GCN5 [Burkholderia sp. SJ98]
MLICGAQSADLAQIKALLNENDLPTTDITAQHLGRFLVVRNPQDTIIACVGLERFSDGALLRSLVVAESDRHAGLGRTLLSEAEHAASIDGCTQIWLLTTTAPDFFQRRGYQPIDRSSVPDDVRKSREFSLLCPASATCLHKRLTVICLSERGSP